MKSTINELASVQVGFTFRSRLESSEDGNIAVIQMRDLLEDNTVCIETLAKVSMQGLSERHFVRKGDLVFRSRGLTTTSAILLDNPGRAIVAAPLLRIRAQEPDKVMPEYLNWCINQKEAQIFLQSRSMGTGLKMISIQALKELEISLPSKEKQKKIVELAQLSAREQVLLHKLADKREQYISTALMQFAKGE